MHDEREIMEKIRSCINKPVNFKFPGSEKKKCGTLKDRVIVPSNNEKTQIPYWDVVDLINFPNEKEKKWIRIGYYRKKERLVWGSQTTITEPVTVWKRLLIKAAREMQWFKDLLQEIVQEL